MVGARPAATPLAERLVWFGFWLLEALLALRLVLILIVVSRQIRIARLIFRLSRPLIAPFWAVSLRIARYSSLELSTLAAMLAVLLLTLALIGVIRFVRRSAPG